MHKDYYYVYKGDDTDAFGGNFLTVNLNVPTGHYVSKFEIFIGILDPIVILDPIFPLQINLTSEQTSMLTNRSKIMAVAYDEENKRQTCEGVTTLVAREQVM